jgi:hypothetical protein
MTSTQAADTVPAEFRPLDQFLRESSRYRRLGPFTVREEGDAGIDATVMAAGHEALMKATPAVFDHTTSHHVASPWHAAIFLQCIQERLLEHVPGKVHSSPLFRGLSDPGYSLITSMDRAPNRPLARNQARCFALLMQQLGNHSVQLDLPVEVFRAVSQHYGFATNLMDWTPDPTVAVYFANRPSGSSKGIIYLGTVDHFLERNLKILLPPPLFERILLQRGVFVEVTGPLEPSKLLRITFDKAPGYCVYQADARVDLLTEPKWSDHARNFILSSADEKTTPPADLWKAWVDSDLAFHFSKETPRFIADQEVPRWLDFYEDMRYWLACAMSESEEIFRKDVVDAIERDNADLVSWHRKFMRALGKPF